MNDQEKSTGIRTGIELERYEDYKRLFDERDEAKKQAEYDEYRRIRKEDRQDRINSLLDSLKEPEYVRISKQKVVVKEREQSENSAFKKKVAAIILGLSLVAGGVMYASHHDDRSEKMLDTFDKYLEYIEETGERPSEEGYQYFIENHLEYSSQEENVKGGR